jgi:hypothetical protein
MITLTLPKSYGSIKPLCGSTGQPLRLAPQAPDRICARCSDLFCTDRHPSRTDCPFGGPVRQEQRQQEE